MRKPFLVKYALFLLASLILVSCSSVSEAERDQIRDSALLLGERFNSLGEHEEALNVYDSALNTVSDYRLFYNKAVTLALLERYDEALSLCSSSFEKYPEIISFLKLENAVYRQCGDIENTVSTYEKILTLDPSDNETRLSFLSYCSNPAAQAEELLKRGVVNNDILTVLYESDSTRWGSLYNLLFTEE